MSLALIVYLAGIAEPLKNFLGLSGVILLVIGVIWWLMSKVEWEPSPPTTEETFTFRGTTIVIRYSSPEQRNLIHNGSS